MPGLVRLLLVVGAVLLVRRIVRSWATKRTVVGGGGRASGRTGPGESGRGPKGPRIEEADYEELD